MQTTDQGVVLLTSPSHMSGYGIERKPFCKWDSISIFLKIKVWLSECLQDQEPQIAQCSPQPPLLRT